MGFFDFLTGAAAKKAARAQVGGLRNAQGELEANRGEISSLFDPAVQGGDRARGSLEALLGLAGPQAQGQAFGQFRESPGFQFALDTGRQGLERSAFARGQGLSGASAEALQRAGIGAANQEFGNFQNRLSGLAQQGGAARGQLGSFLTNNATNQANIFGQIGQAQAGGIINQANQRAGTFNTLGGLAGRALGNFF